MPAAEQKFNLKYIWAISFAPLTWVLIAEIFPNRIRGAAMSVTV